MTESASNIIKPIQNQGMKVFLDFKIRLKSIFSTFSSVGFLAPVSSIVLIFSFPLILNEEFPTIAKVLSLLTTGMLFVGIRLYAYFIFGTICEILYFIMSYPLLLFFWHYVRNTGMLSNSTLYLIMLAIIVDFIFFFSEKDSLRRFIRSIRHPMKKFDDIFSPFIALQAILKKVANEYNIEKNINHDNNTKIVAIEHETIQINTKTDMIKNKINDMYPTIYDIKSKVTTLISEIEDCDNSNSLECIGYNLEAITKQIKQLTAQIYFKKILKGKDFPLTAIEIYRLEKCGIDIFSGNYWTQEKMREGLGVLFKNREALSEDEFFAKRRVLRNQNIKHLKKYNIDHLLMIIAKEKNEKYNKDSFILLKKYYDANIKIFLSEFKPLLPTDTK